MPQYIEATSMTRMLNLSGLPFDPTGTTIR